MKILIITSTHPYKASGVVALDLYNSLKKVNGYDVKIITKSYAKFSNQDFLSYHSKIDYFISTIFRKFKTLLKELQMYKPRLSKTNLDYTILDYNQTKTPLSSKKFLRKVGFTPDAVIVLFNVRFLSYKNLYEINKATKASILLYMMDMAPMTGGCHYAWDCKGYMNKCGYCPALYSNIENDQSRKNWEFKKKYINKTNLSVISGTEHQFKQLQKSSLFQDIDKYKILLSIDPQVFMPGDKNAARKQLKLPLDKKIIFFGASNINSKRKGIKKLIDSLDILYDKTRNSTTIHLAIAGGGTEKITNKLKFTYSLLGRLNHEELAKVFQASDLFLCPSIEDSGPMMINQSIMCGTPVVSFDMGVARDLVITGETGYRAILGDADDLATGIKSIIELNNSNNNEMSENCYQQGINKCHPKVQQLKFEKVLIKNFVDTKRILNKNDIIKKYNKICIKYWST